MVGFVCNICETSLVGSSRSPKKRAPAGHTSMQAGVRFPASTLWKQNVHFSATPTDASVPIKEHNSILAFSKCSNWAYFDAGCVVAVLTINGHVAHADVRISTGRCVHLLTAV